MHFLTPPRASPAPPSPADPASRAAQLAAARIAYLDAHAGGEPPWEADEQAADAPSDTAPPADQPLYAPAPEPRPRKRKRGGGGGGGGLAAEQDVTSGGASAGASSGAASDPARAHPAERSRNLGGRPRKVVVVDPNAPPVVKRPPGRPRIHPLPDPNAPKRPRGRPRIHPLPDPNAPKRPRGRPPKHRRKAAAADGDVAQLLPPAPTGAAACDGQDGGASDVAGVSWLNEEASGGASAALFDQEQEGAFPGGEDQEHHQELPPGFALLHPGVSAVRTRAPEPRPQGSDSQDEGSPLTLFSTGSGAESWRSIGALASALDGGVASPRMPTAWACPATHVGGAGGSRLWALCDGTTAPVDAPPPSGCVSTPEANDLLPPVSLCAGEGAAVHATAHGAVSGGIAQAEEEEDSPLGRLPLPRALEHLFDAVRPGEEAPGEGDVAAAHAAVGRHLRSRSPPPPLPTDEPMHIAAAEPPAALPQPSAASCASRVPGFAAAHAPLCQASASSFQSPLAAHHLPRMSLDGDVDVALAQASAAAAAAAAASAAARQLVTPQVWRAGARGALSGGRSSLSSGAGGGSSRSSRGSYLAQLAATAPVPPPAAARAAPSPAAEATLPLLCLVGEAAVTLSSLASPTATGALSPLPLSFSPSPGAKGTACADGAPELAESAGVPSLRLSLPLLHPRGILKALLPADGCGAGTPSGEAAGSSVFALAAAREALSGAADALAVLVKAVERRLSLTAGSPACAAAADAQLAAALAAAAAPAVRAREEAAKLAVRTPDFGGEEARAGHLALGGASAQPSAPQAGMHAGVRKGVRFAPADKLCSYTII